jgi:alpha-glucosidase (family GH31 glycosyl hydrolase)
VLLYFRAFVGRDEIGTDRPSLVDYAIRHGYVATHADGSPYVFQTNFFADGAMIDFTKPSARRWWSRRIAEALDLGADGFMQDFGEQVLLDMHFHDGSTGRTMHNRLPVLFHRATRRAIDAYRARHPGHGEVYFFTRSGYSGLPGSVAYENATWPGDEPTDWSRSAGLAAQAPDMLNRGIAGAYGFGTDIGGYFDVGRTPTTKELFLRWAEWAALTPIFRLHGSVAAGTHAPWTYDAQTVRIYRRLSQLHVAAAPLIARLWRVAARTGMPIARPLWLAAPGDRRAAAEDQEWLLGPNVLVAPVVVQGARRRTVYFPRGCWVSPVSGRRYSGGRAALVPAPLAALPYFFRCRTAPFVR